MNKTTLEFNLGLMVPMQGESKKAFNLFDKLTNDLDGLTLDFPIIDQLNGKIEIKKKKSKEESGKIYGKPIRNMDVMN